MTNIKQKLPSIQENVSLKNYTTFKIGGSAKYFFIAKNEKEIIKVVKTAKELNLNYFILGNGSNILISDKGFDGIVIKVEPARIASQSDAGGSRKLKVESQTIYAEAGVKLGNLIKFSVDNNLSGLEWAAGIPGTLGGAIRGNAGAFGKSMADIIQEVTTLNKDLRFTIYDLPARNVSLARNAISTAGKRSDTGRRNIKFGYRDSIFKHNKDIIFSAILKLEKGDSKISKKKIQEYLQKRKSIQPLEYPSAGSIFKNILFSEVSPEAFKKCSKLEQFRQSGKIPAGWLIENAGLKGKKIGGAQISEKHSNFIINTGNASAEDVVILISLIKQKVRNKFDLQLMEEIEYIGF